MSKRSGLWDITYRAAVTDFSREYKVGSLRGKQSRTGLASAKQAATNGQSSRGAGVQEFQTFYQENLGLIYRYVYSKVGNREEAEDLTSQIFMKAVRGVDTERGPQSMQKWLFQVARTTIADYWRGPFCFGTQFIAGMLGAGWGGT